MSAHLVSNIEKGLVEDKLVMKCSDVQRLSLDYSSSSYLRNHFEEPCFGWQGLYWTIKMTHRLSQKPIPQLSFLFPSEFICQLKLNYDTNWWHLLFLFSLEHFYNCLPQIISTLIMCWPRHEEMDQCCY